MRERFARIGYDLVVVATATWVLFSGAGFPSIVAFVLLNLGALAVFRNRFGWGHVCHSRPWDAPVILVGEGMLFLWPTLLTLDKQEWVSTLVGLGVMLTVRALLIPRLPDAAQRTPRRRFAGSGEPGSS